MNEFGDGGRPVLDQRRIEFCVEALCHKGCKSVWRDIAALEDGLDLPETRELSPPERRAVLAELKAIMAVYGQGSCPVG
jgi:hypothetical protein